MEGKEKANKRKVTELQQSAAKSLQDGDMEEAIVLLTRAIFLDDKDPDLYDMRAVAFQEIGDMASALNNLKKVNKLTISSFIDLSILYFHCTKLLHSLKEEMLGEKGGR